MRLSILFRAAENSSTRQQSLGQSKILTFIFFIFSFSCGISIFFYQTIQKCKKLLPASSNMLTILIIYLTQTGRMYKVIQIILYWTVIYWLKHRYSIHLNLQLESLNYSKQERLYSIEKGLSDRNKVLEEVETDTNILDKQLPQDVTEFFNNQVITSDFKSHIHDDIEINLKKVKLKLERIKDGCYQMEEVGLTGNNKNKFLVLVTSYEGQETDLYVANLHYRLQSQGYSYCIKDVKQVKSKPKNTRRLIRVG